MHDRGSLIRSYAVNGRRSVVASVRVIALSKIARSQDRPSARLASNGTDNLADKVKFDTWTLGLLDSTGTMVVWVEYPLHAGGGCPMLSSGDILLVVCCA